MTSFWTIKLWIHYLLTYSLLAYWRGLLIQNRYGPSTRITDGQKYQEALTKAQEIKAKQDAEITTLGRTFIRDANEADAFSKLFRYETAIQRSFSKALHELQRFHTARGAGGNVSPPVAVDVDLSAPSSEGL